MTLLSVGVVSLWKTAGMVKNSGISFQFHLINVSFNFFSFADVYIYVYIHENYI